MRKNKAPKELSRLEKASDLICFSGLGTVLRIGVIFSLGFTEPKGFSHHKINTYLRLISH